MMSVSFGKSIDEIVETSCDGEGELFRCGIFVSFLLPLLLLFLFTFKLLKLSISINDSHLTEVSESSLICM